MATTRPEADLEWPNSIALAGTSVGGPEVPDAVSELRAGGDGSLGVMGSSVLVHELQRRHLIDEYVLLVHPLVLGHGIRVFEDGSPPEPLELAAPVRTSKAGVVASVYRPRR